MAVVMANRRDWRWLLGTSLALAACAEWTLPGVEVDEAGDTASDATSAADSDPPPTTGDPDDGESSGSSGDPTTASTTGDDDPAPADTSGESSGDPDSGDTGDPTDADDDGECPDDHDPCDHLSDHPLHALGLDCTNMGDGFVDGVNAVDVSAFDFNAGPPGFGKRAWQVARSYGTHVDPATAEPFWSPREGKLLLLISTGLLPAPNAQGAVIINDSSVYNDVADGDPWDSDELPPPMQPHEGSPDPDGHVDCDGVGDCSNTVWTQWLLGGKNPDDKLWFSFEVTAPPQTSGYSFDFAYFSAEFPEFVGSAYNDIFLVWQSSETYTGNVTFIDGRPITVTAVWPIEFEGECDWDDDDCVGLDPHLAGTGHLTDGGATGWYRATGGVQPGETIGLAFAIFDMGDSNFDSTAVLDNWRWDCAGCVPSEVDSCGVDPQ
jgi:hypothetical protein